MCVCVCVLVLIITYILINWTYFREGERERDKERVRGVVWGVVDRRSCDTDHQLSLKDLDGGGVLVEVA